jgi:hypothetical protein
MEKIAILTNFQDFHPRYSLTGIVQDQVRMLLSYGHEVHLFTCTQFNSKDAQTLIEAVSDKRFHLRHLIPFGHLIDYRSIEKITEEHKGFIQDITNVMVAELKDFDIAFTHDFVFTGWNLPYSQACRRAGQHLPKLRWFHWIHSVPTIMSDWWDIKKYGPNHKIIYPNETDRLLVAEQYRGTRADIRSIPHIKDFRSWFDFSENTCRFIKKYPGVLQADVVQILPASVDRLKAKRVKEVFQIFSYLKRQARTVCLVVANQWATGRQQKEDVEGYKKYAESLGLYTNREVIFTSDFESPNFDVGIPKEMIRELFQCSNLFIFPTREESFGLVVPEASLSGGVLLVLNKSLRMQFEVSGGHALFFDFGSYHHQFHTPDYDIYCRDIAKIITGRMMEDESILSKTFMRQTYNWDNLYLKKYAPIMAESKGWVK